MGLLFGYLISLVTTFVVSAMLLSSLIGLTASNTNHSARYISLGKSTGNGLHTDHTHRSRIVRSPDASSGALLAQMEPNGATRKAGREQK